MSIAKSIRDKSKTKGFAIADSQTQKLHTLFDSLFFMPHKQEEEIAFEKSLFDNRYADRKGLHISSIISPESSFCKREQYLSLNNTPVSENFSPNILRIFEEGNYVHRKWQRLFLRGNLTTYDKLDHTFYNEQYNISFTPDAILKVGNRELIVEIKSMNTFIFKDHSKYLSPLNKAKLQLQMYLYLYGCKHGLVLVEDKNSQEYKLTLVKYDPEVVGPFIKRLESITKLTGTPKRHKLCTSDLSKKVTNCPMRHVCFDDG